MILQTFDAATYAYVLSEIAKEDGPDILLITSTKMGKETAGRTAQRLESGCITDAIDLRIDGSDLVVDRYALGGNTISSEIIKTRKKVISVLPRAFEPQPAPAAGKLETIDLKLPSKRVEIVERRRKVGEKVSIDSAETLVCVGQGIAKKDDLAMINELCAVLKAELGCTRTLSADFHWLSEDRMVGISGKKCKPQATLLNRCLGPNSTHRGNNQFKAHRRNKQGQRSADLQDSGLRDCWRPLPGRPKAD